MRAGTQQQEITGYKNATTIQMQHFLELWRLLGNARHYLSQPHLPLTPPALRWRNRSQGSPEQSGIPSSPAEESSSAPLKHKPYDSGSLLFCGYSDPLSNGIITSNMHQNHARNGQIMSNRHWGLAILISGLYLTEN